MTLEPGPPVPDQPPESSVQWSKLFPTQSSPGLSAQVQEWATAFAADDRGDLQRLAGDSTSAPGTYSGLGGWTVLSVSLDSPINPSETDPDLMWVQTGNDNGNWTQLQINS